METEWIDYPSVRVMGISIRADNSRPWEIGDLWHQFLATSYKEIPSMNGDIYAVYNQYEKDHTAPYTLLVGRVVDDQTEVLEGMEIRIIPARRYLQIKSEGKMPEALVRTWQEIWQASTNQTMDRSWTLDFELHSLNSPNQVLVHLSMNNK